jgi:4-aminobutyrate aminotransferase
MSPSISRIYPLVMGSAEGCIVRDVDGNEFIDFNSASGVVCVGHAHSKIIGAVKQQAEASISYSNSVSYSEILAKLSKELSTITPILSDKKILYSNSRDEAIEAGIKAAMWHTHNHRILSFIGAYHGSTLGALSLAAVNTTHVKRFPILFTVDHIPYPYCYRCPFKQSYPECKFWCIEYIEELLNRNVPSEELAAIVFEPIQGNAGCIVPPSGYFQRLKRLAEKYDLLLMDDESQTSIGRVGRWFAIEDSNINPNILCINGSLSSGLPLGATISSGEVMDWEPESHVSLLGGNPIACSVALAVLDVIKSEHLLENSAKQGNYILRRLREMAEKYNIIGDVRGKGLMVGFEVVKDLDKKEYGVTDAREIVRKSFRRGVLLDVSGASVVQITPPLSITQELLDRGLEIIEGAVSEVAAGEQ